jgi:hypothetical protein
LEVPTCTRQDNKIKIKPKLFTLLQGLPGGHHRQFMIVIIMIYKDFFPKIYEQDMVISCVYIYHTTNPAVSKAHFVSLAALLHRVQHRKAVFMLLIYSIIR